MTVHIAYDDRLLGWRLGEGHPSDPIRALNAVRRLHRSRVPIEVHPTREATLDELRTVHSESYLRRLIRLGESTEWEGKRPEMVAVARLMFGGTMGLVDGLLSAGGGLSFAPQGAKHHAHRDHASGFCVLNDFAAAALRFRDEGHRVLYVDFDGHHGDGVEAILRTEPGIVTCSIHDGTAFPGTGRHSEPKTGTYNWPLARWSGNRALLGSIKEVMEIASGFRPTVLLVAAGADGHKTDPLTSLTYTTPGLTEAARILATIDVRTTLIGGAGGYRPKDVTPLVWSEVVKAFHKAHVAR